MKVKRYNLYYQTKYYYVLCIVQDILFYIPSGSPDVLL